MFGKLITFALVITIDAIIIKLFWGGIKKLSLAPVWMVSSQAVAKRIVESAPKLALKK